MDIELLAQTAALKAADPARAPEMQLRAGRKSGWLSAGDEAELARSYRLFWSFHAAARLLADGPLDPDRLGEGGCAVLLRETGQDEGGITGLSERLTAAAARAEALIDAHIGPPSDRDAEVARKAE
jgi:glutamate-ammonia-ligase adenylyltransferase